MYWYCPNIHLYMLDMWSLSIDFVLLIGMLELYQQLIRDQFQPRQIVIQTGGLRMSGTDIWTFLGS